MTCGKFKCYKVIWLRPKRRGQIKCLEIEIQKHEANPYVIKSRPMSRKSSYMR